MRSCFDKLTQPLTWLASRIAIAAILLGLMVMSSCSKKVDRANTASTGGPKSSSTNPLQIEAALGSCLSKSRIAVSCLQRLVSDVTRRATSHGTARTIAR